MVSGLDTKHSDAEFTSMDVKEADQWVGAEVGNVEPVFEDSKYFEKESERHYSAPGVEVYVVGEEESPTDDEGFAYNVETDEADLETCLEASTEFAAGVMPYSDDVEREYAEGDVETALRNEFKEAYTPKVMTDGGRNYEQTEVADPENFQGGMQSPAPSFEENYDPRDDGADHDFGLEDKSAEAASELMDWEQERQVAFDGGEKIDEKADGSQTMKDVDHNHTDYDAPF